MTAKTEFHNLLVLTVALHRLAGTGLEGKVPTGGWDLMNLPDLLKTKKRELNILRQSCILTEINEN